MFLLSALGILLSLPTNSVGRLEDEADDRKMIVAAIFLGASSYCTSYWTLGNPL